MKFGPVPTDEASGAILAHSLNAGDRRVRKGTILSRADCDALQASGHASVICARMEPGDVHEDDAARRLGQALAGDAASHLDLADAFTGRVNLHAGHAGLMVADAPAINAANAVDEAITIATLENHARVGAGRMVATVKIIPFAVSGETLDKVCAIASGALRVAPFRPLKVGLVATTLPVLKASVMDKTARILGERLATYGGEIVAEVRCAHDKGSIADAIASLDDTETDLTVVFGASAIVDRRDEVPEGIEAAGGTVEHFGMPVDPGNLLLLARRNGKPVLGAPGCARSPKENGFDWVLDRLAAGLPVTRGDVTAMGVGGLLMEIPSRPQPRNQVHDAESSGLPVGAVILAAGRSTRMGGPHKLLEDVGGMSLVRRCAQAVLASRAAPVVVVTGHRSGDVRAALDGLGVVFVENPDHAQGLSTSLAAGLKALPADVHGAAICLADMPGVDAALIDRLIETFSDGGEAAIVVPTAEGKRGNPVIWGRRYFEALCQVSGDVGGKALIGENPAQVIEVDAGRDALRDVDTPEALAAARRDYGA
ncbi:NTP transferase domain-containing protein [Tepidamorphus sp. 3E244]|uniref:NTP transferase domain-containing protein n=1 Tax=Tepidamorphus sp. 3E244 TaxID=3385498 RepID=UPI0038FD1E49